MGELIGYVGVGNMGGAVAAALAVSRPVKVFDLSPEAMAACAGAIPSASLSDVAAACRAVGVRTVAVTAGYITPAARPEFFAGMDAANVDLKAFSDDFYHRLCAAELGPVLDTLRYLARSPTWLEVTTLLIPGHNDSNAEITALARWIANELGPEVPLHLTAFHPDWKMNDLDPTPLATLRHARRLALDAGLHYVYTGNVRDSEGGTTFCPGCHAALIERDGYTIRRYDLPDDGRCPHCRTPIAGHFGRFGKPFGAQRIPVRLARR